MSVVSAYRPWSLLPRALAVSQAVSQACPLHTHTAQLNSNRSSVVRCGRQVYERGFPVLLLRPDGSTVHIRYREPRRLLVMPVDVSMLSEEERRLRLKKREVKRSPQTPQAEEYHDQFRADQYTQFWKKK
ncbi:39S ribosomal protein L55, mitochondrial [Periophthalmus magnuspinnatus]|uniref:39S ribosomal protein L55, mitochondrial n=1 Tax=Periophthalmus magnuspinnatus TaxID=409849 RepID=UPI00145AC567|nr:39S ribosomal protein L55, mitochondrial [Periophthalmus magnuspinnatus]